MISLGNIEMILCAKTVEPSGCCDQRVYTVELYDLL